MTGEELSKPIKMGSFKKGIAANRQQYENTIKNLDPNTVSNRLGLVVDDSSSMGHDGMEDVHKAVRSFTNNCDARDTSIAVYPLNKGPKGLVCDFDLINLYVGGLWSTGGTPIYGVLDNLIETEKITRSVLFSDGEPTDSSILKKEQETYDDFYYGSKDPQKAVTILTKFKQKEIKIDTIFIGPSDTVKGYREMKAIADFTGGIFIWFKDTSSLNTGLKYLAPKHRALLANPEIKAKIERGEQI